MSNHKRHKKDEPERSRGAIMVYQSDDGRVKLDVRLEDETVWLTQKLMAELFQVKPQNITMHLKNIYSEGELSEKATCKDFLQVQSEGNRKVSRKQKYYNLDSIISVGYRIKSHIATRFRIWATQRLKEYIVKGFAMDDERLKEAGSSRYFEELLARIRDIRSSEKVFWRKVLDIYATSIDYNPTSDASKLFFRQVQNKMHWAAHNHTAAELIYARADARKRDMGITNYPGRKLLKRDVEIAKNYLSENELNILNRVVTAYLEVAELQALNQIPMTMNDWIERLHQFLTMTGRELLSHAGKITHEAALRKAWDEYEKFRLKRLNEPTEVEKHFIEAEKGLKRIESSKKSHLRKPDNSGKGDI
ncbi:MAG: virulence RhuM family protein [Candidatus Omnitrophica bacterium]|nr:virulence RhuM family protein [Candidatus Omnitrophota bacterium]